MWQKFNNNPVGRMVGDCSVRAVSVALNTDWEKAYILISVNGFSMGDMPSSDSVWGSVLRQNGFKKAIIEGDATAEEFCNDNPCGTFVLGFGGHVATVVDGILYDSWDSSSEIPVYVWYKDEAKG